MRLQPVNLRLSLPCSLYAHARARYPALTLRWPLGSAACDAAPRTVATTSGKGTFGFDFPRLLRRLLVVVGETAGFGTPNCPCVCACSCLVDWSAWCELVSAREIIGGTSKSYHILDIPPLRGLGGQKRTDAGGASTSPPGSGRASVRSILDALPAHPTRLASGPAGRIAGGAHLQS